MVGIIQGAYNLYCKAQLSIVCDILIKLFALLELIHFIVVDNIMIIMIIMIILGW